MYAIAFGAMHRSYSMTNKSKLLHMPQRLMCPISRYAPILSLADGSVYALAHRPLRFMLVLVIDAFALMLLLNRIRSGLEG